MGTDIHLYIEFLDGNESNPRRLSLTAGQFELGRNYDVFDALAGVRGGDALIPPRGFPIDASDEVFRAYYAIVVDVPQQPQYDGDWQYHHRDSADRWVASGKSHRITHSELEFVSDPDAHSASWLTRAEFIEAVKTCGETHGYNDRYNEWNAVIGAMNVLPDKTDPRVVFWFDN
jgi:hypothetical protein